MRLVNPSRILSDFQLSGGSGAQLDVTEVDGKIKVRKSISGSSLKASKLSKQFEWLAERKNSAHVAEVSDLYHNQDYCHYYLKYYDGFSSFNDFLRAQSREDTSFFLDKILSFMNDEIHQRPSTIRSKDLFQHYLTLKLHDKVLDCSRQSREFRKVLSYSELIINGKSYQNFTSCFLKIQNDPRIKKANSIFTQSEIHGDLTFENILIHPKTYEFVLIDPNLDNAISSPMIDFSKLCQSARSRYEDMKLIGHVSLSKNEINFCDKTLKPDHLTDSLMASFSRRLSESDIINLSLHEAIHFSRMLPYKIEQQGELFPLFYARMIILLNEYIELLES